MPRWTSLQIHDSETPRSRSTSPCVRSCLQGVDRGLDQVDRVGRAEALGEDVVDAAASQTARTAAPAITPVPGAGRHEHHLGRAEVALRPCAGWCVPCQVDGDHAAGAVLDGLFDGGRHFVGLAVAPADLALAVADDDQGGEAEPPAALDHRGAAADLDRPCRSVRRGRFR